MRNFTFQLPTQLIFGKGSVDLVGSKAKAFGERILLVSGGGSIKKIGYYDRILNSLKSEGLKLFELGGVKSNPDISKVREGVQICRDEGIEFILAVGGGSVLDTGKTIGVGFYSDKDPWEIFTTGEVPSRTLPVGTVLTLAATGSEMNGGAVMSNAETEEKLLIGRPYMVPRFSILDPEITYSVPKDYTVYGIVDIATHVYEQYFDQVQDTPLQDRMAESVLRTLITESAKVLSNPRDYAARSNIMLCGTFGLNGLLSMGKESDWASHGMQNILSAIYDIPHGGGLAIIVPKWMEYVYEANVSKFACYAREVFRVDSAGRTEKEVALEGIKRTRAWFNDMGAPSRLADFGIDDTNLEVMAERVTSNGPLGTFKKLFKEDVLNIYKMCL